MLLARVPPFKIVGPFRIDLQPFRTAAAASVNKICEVITRLIVDRVLADRDVLLARLEKISEAAGAPPASPEHWASLRDIAHECEAARSEDHNRLRAMLSTIDALSDLLYPFEADVMTSLWKAAAAPARVEAAVVRVDSILQVSTPFLSLCDVGPR